MTLEEAIKHAEDIADTCEYEASKYDMSDPYESHVACQEGECAEEHRQLAEWLKDYKRLLEQQPILDKIKAEIDTARFIDKDTKLCKNANASGLEVAIQIIDKYKAEGSDKE